MGKPTRIRTVVAFAAKFVVFVPVCLVLWWLFLPVYAWCLGLVTELILRYITQAPVESFGVGNTGLTNPDGLLNTGTQLSFTIGGRTRMLPELGSVVTNVAPFVALVLATPGLRLLRRSVIIAIGVAVLVVTHISFILMAFYAGQSEISMAIAQAFITLPFLLWIVMAYWDKLGAYLVPPKAPSAAPSPPDRKG